MTARLCKTFIFCLLTAYPLPSFALSTVTVLADSSMNIAMAELARDYARQHNIVVNASFAASARQETQINEGGAADILITPKLPWIETLKTQGLIDIYSQTVIARNRLALVAPSTDTTINSRIADGFPTATLIRTFGWQPSFLVGNPETLLEGTYGKEALRNLGVAGDLEEFTLYVKRLDQMFDMVAHHGMYGIFFYSSTVGKPDIRVIDLLPENSHQPVEYNAMAIAGDNMESARDFLRYLQSDTAKSILRNNGFSVN